MRNPIFGSWTGGSNKLTPTLFANLSDVTLADEHANSIPTGAQNLKLYQVLVANFAIER